MVNQPHILIVDDNLDLAEAIAFLLESKGYSASTAGDGVEALEFLQADPSVALMVLDLNMPRMDGQTLLGRIRQDPRLNSLPVVIFSAEPESLQNQVQAIIKKPADSDSLVAAIETTLSNHYRNAK
jgi:CheY-like chemotaxis protein